MRGRGRLGLVAAAIASGGLLVAPAAGAATAGTAVIVKPGTTTPLGGGASTTPYGVDLPAGAGCPGDTQHDGYRVYSYLVPAGHQPTEVSFKTALPGRWYGYFARGAYVGALNTAASTGQVVGLPSSFTWTRLTPGELIPGGRAAATWEGGIACVNSHGAVTDYWNNAVRFTADPGDPSGFTWKVVGQGSLASSFDSAPFIGLGLLVIAAAAGAYGFALRRARKDHDHLPAAGGHPTGAQPLSQPEPPVQHREPVGS